MDVRIRFRFNKTTGEVEVFDVEDEGGARLPEAEHNRRHDEIAASVGGVVERFPEVQEVAAGDRITSGGSVETGADADAAQRVPERRRSVE